jgi:replication-associated recombination protein RarA
MLDYSGPDLMHILKEMADEMQNQSAQSSFSDDENVRDFMTQLCNTDSRNFLTPAELLE